VILFLQKDIIFEQCLGSESSQVQKADQLKTSGRKCDKDIFHGKERHMGATNNFNTCQQSISVPRDHTPLSIHVEHHQTIDRLHACPPIRTQPFTFCSNGSTQPYIICIPTLRFAHFSFLTTFIYLFIFLIILVHKYYSKARKIFFEFFFWCWFNKKIIVKLKIFFHLIN
jgi:hypothetical protein